MGISVWLVPSDDERELLERLMSHHPTCPPRSASYPTFQPHITLGSFPSSNTDFVKLRESIPMGLSSMPLSFATVLTGDHYFRSIYVSIIPTEPLTDLYKGIHKALGNDEPSSPAFPHMSLYYIVDEDAKEGERERMLKEMVSSGVIKVPEDVKERGGGVVLDCGVGTVPEPDPDALVRLDGIVGSEIWIVKCEGPVEGWEVLDKILLAKGKH